MEINKLKKISTCPVNVLLLQGQDALFVISRLDGTQQTEKHNHQQLTNVTRSSVR
jgi:hypothetical protein